MSDQEHHPHDTELDAPPVLPATSLALTASPRLQAVRSQLLVKDPAADRETSSGGALAGYLHAFRRRWLLAMTLGTVGGLAAAAATWFSFPIKFTATALIQISADNPKRIFKIDDTHSSFDVYKGTQMQLLTSDFVLVRALGALAEEQKGAETLNGEEDPLRFLSKSLQIESPDKAEIVRVSLTAQNKDDAANIVEAVVNAYMSDVVEKDKQARADRLKDVNDAYAAKEDDMRRKWAALQNLSNEVGTDDKGALAIKQQLLMQQYGEARTEWNRLRIELQTAKAALRVKSLTLEARQKRPAEAIEDQVDELVKDDPTCIRVQEDLEGLDLKIAEARQVYKPGSSALRTAIEGLGRARQSLEDRLENRRRHLAAKLKLTSPDGDRVELDIKNLNSQVKLLTDEEQQAETSAKELRKQAERLGASSVEVEMTRDQIQGLERVLATIGNEREELQVEHDSLPRITWPQHATRPAAPDKSSRLQNTITLGLFGFLAPVGLLLWWDVRGRRINSIRDVADGLGVTVIGSVPHIMTGGKASGRRLRRHRQLQMCVDHSIDGIAAKLFLRRDAGGARVVLVSSATRGEGKSTLSIQLAKRLARTGASTLLVDFDLRKPSLHQVFDAPRGPGLTEFLRGSDELQALIRPTDVENLSILTAGSPFSDSLGTLSNGVTGSLFDKARGEYDFVIVDGSPILPVVDALLTSQHVDAVVLSVRRDVSQADRVRAACDQLKAFGVEDYVAVLTGSNEDLYYYGNHELAALETGHGPR
jgi:capsular exopolysaccharide synthesis family protein